MLILGRGVIDEAMRRHARLRGPIRRWIELAESAQWTSIADARATFPTADAVKETTFTCFNISGNSFRLIAVVDYPLQQLVIREVLTHAEYDKKY